MKSRALPNLLLLAVFTATVVAFQTNIQAATYDKAEVTRIHNEVTVVRSDNVSRPAKVGEEVNRISSVTTGDASRAELRFPDKSLTRLGANSRFTLREGARTIDLDQGVMLLQVPKRLGGAKVRTAAVTAAVTGTTVLFEYLPNGYIKLIVIEGEVDLFLNDKPSQFRTIKAGDMIIMPSNGNHIPEPVQVDLKRLLDSSKLISGNEDWLPNHREVQDAVRGQQRELKKGELVGTNLFLPGRGTTVSIQSNTPLQILRTQHPSHQPNPGNHGGSSQHGRPHGQTPLGGGIARIDGTTLLNNGSTITTNPHVTAYNSVNNSYGTFEGATYDGSKPFPVFAFGTPRLLDVDPLNPVVSDHLESHTWATFRFEDLIINGTPSIYVNGADSLILAADKEIRFDIDHEFGTGAGEYWEDTLNLRHTGLKNLTVYSQTGNVWMSEHFSIIGPDVNLTLIAAGLSSDIFINGNISLTKRRHYYHGYSSNSSDPKGQLLVSAGRDVHISSTTETDALYDYKGIKANRVEVQAKRDINMNNYAKVQSRGDVKFTARRNINITDSAQLKVLAHNPEILAQLETMQGDINISGTNGYQKVRLTAPQLELLARQGNINIQNSVISSDVFKAQTLGANGWINIGDHTRIKASELLTLYAAGANGGIRFTGNVVLDSSDIRIAGQTVEIVEGKHVKLSKGAGSTTIYTNNPQFKNANPDLQKGRFKYKGQGTLNIQSFQNPNNSGNNGY